MKGEPTVQQLFDLSGRTALITGASGHLGHSMADALAEAGARVIVASRKIATARKVAASLPRRSADFSPQQPPTARTRRTNSAPRLSRQEISELGRSQNEPHGAIAMDHMDERSINSGFDSALRQAQKLDILVCNGHELLGKDLRSVTPAEFNRQLQNATGYFLLARKFHDHVVQRQSQGSVIMLGSMYGVVGSYPEVYTGLAPANPVAYQTLKGGIIQMVRHLAVYWAKDGVRVNCLSPGPFPSSGASPALVRRLKKHSPLARMGQPYELKGAVLFLASDASSYVTGQNLLVDGGWTAW